MPASLPPMISNFMPDLLLSDAVDFSLQGEGVKRCQRQAEEEADAAIESDEGFGRRPARFPRRSLHGRRIGDAPMSRHRLTRPIGADFLRCVVADSEYKVKWRRVGPRELVPGLAAKTFACSCVRLQSGEWLLVARIRTGWLPAL